MNPMPRFGGDDVPPVPPERARTVILPVPYERTTTYGKGTSRGPAALLAASGQVELFDEELGLDPMDGGVATLPPATADAMPDALAERLEPVVRAHLAAGRVVGALGGEHSVSLGPIRAAARAHLGLGVLQIDAHPDLRDAYEGTRYGHGCVMRRVLDDRSVGALVQVGLRAVSPEDAEAQRADRRVRPFHAFDLARRDRADWVAAVVEALPREVYLTFDVDGLDPSIVPGTGTPEPGGLGWWDAMALLREVAARRRVVAFDVVELLPQRDAPLSEFAAARLVMKILGYLAAARR